MVGLIENIGDSFKFGFVQCYGDGFKGFLRMLALLVLSFIPIINFIPSGIFLKICREEKPDFTNAGKSFSDGFLLFVIGIIYVYIPTVILTIANVMSGNASVATFILIAILIVIVVLCLLVVVPAVINLSRNGFAAAFKFPEIFGMIANVGVAKYLLSYVLFLIVAGGITAILTTLIAFVTPVGIILAIFVFVPIEFFCFRFWTNHFET